MSQLNTLDIAELKTNREAELELKRAATSKLLAADRLRAEAVLLNLRYQLDRSVSTIEIK